MQSIRSLSVWKGKLIRKTGQERDAERPEIMLALNWAADMKLP